MNNGTEKYFCDNIIPINFQGCNIEGPTGHCATVHTTLYETESSL